MITGFLDMGCQWAESLMTDTVEGTVSGEDVWDEEQQQYVPGVTTAYTGPARLKFGTVERNTEDAGAYVDVQPATLSLPLEGTGDIPIGAVFTVTASQTDVGNVGRKFRVTGVFAQTHATARRLAVEHYQ